MTRRQISRLLCGLVPVLAVLAARGSWGEGSPSPSAEFTVAQGSALVAPGRYTLDLSDAAAAPARILTAGQQIEGLALNHVGLEGFVLFRVDSPDKFAVFVYPGAHAAGASTYACRSAAWSQGELQAIDDAPEIDLGLAALGGALPVCTSDVEADARAHRIHIRGLPLQRVSAPDERIVVSTLLQYRLP